MSRTKKETWEVAQGLTKNKTAKPEFTAQSDRPSGPDLLPAAGPLLPAWA